MADANRTNSPVGPPDPPESYANFAGGIPSRKLDELARKEQEDVNRTTEAMKHEHTCALLKRGNFPKTCDCGVRRPCPVCGSPWPYAKGACPHCGNEVAWPVTT